MLFVAIPILALWLIGAVFAIALARAAGKDAPAAASSAVRRIDAA